MRARSFVASAARSCALSALGIPVAAPRAEAGWLLSIGGEMIGAEEYLASFDLHPIGLTVTAVCHVPRDWVIEASDSHDDRARLSGYAHHAGLPAAAIGELQDLFLVDVPEGAASEAKSAVPPGHISGEAGVGRYGEGVPRNVVIPPAALRWRSAMRCPDPH